MAGGASGEASAPPVGQEVIAAIATARGVGAIAVVRLTGEGALEVLGRLIEGEAPEVRRPVVRKIVDPATGTVVDQAVVTIFRGPASYTGEDVIEISCHGGRLTPELVLDCALLAGARRADPGEFSRRAYLNGRLDLLQAEAIADLIEADAPVMRESALRRLDRGLSDRVEALREALIHLIALVSYGVDFPEEDEPPVSEARILGEAHAVEGRLERLVRSAPEGERLSAGALVVLAGPPNAGKSALFNALLGRDRAIVTEIAGTTRDAIEGAVVIEGYPFRLVDTAGLRDTRDRVEGIGIEVARGYLHDADVVLFCTEAGGVTAAESEAFVAEIDPDRLVRVATKADRGGTEVGGKRIEVSALTGQGMEVLRQELADRSFGDARTRQEVPIVTRRRHRMALERARQEVCAFREAVGTIGMDVAEIHLRDAVAALEGLIGVVAPDDVLDDLFSRFCVGK